MAGKDDSTELLAKDIGKQDAEVERSESSTTESGKYLQDIEKSGAVAAEGAEISGGSSTDGYVENQQVPCIEVPAASTKNIERHVDFSGNSPASSSTISSRSLQSGQSISSCEATELARVAAVIARNAATSCRIEPDAAFEAVIAGKERVEAALRRSQSDAQVGDSDHFRTLAANYSSVLNAATLEVNKIEVVETAAKLAAECADAAAKALSEVRDETSLEEKYRIRTACWSSNTANTAAIVAFKIELSVLKALKKLWQRIDEAENVGTEAEVRRRRIILYGPNAVPRKHSKVTKMAHCIAFFIGCCLLASLAFHNFSTDAFYAVVVISAIMLVCPIIYAIYRTVVCYKDKKFRTKLSETKAAINIIDGRIGGLMMYFENNSISVASSRELDTEE